MENRFEQTPEEQGWKAPLPPRTDPSVQRTPYPGQFLQEPVPIAPLRDNLCAWVREKLSDLLDNDGSVRPEQAAGIYAHLAICRSCAQEFDEMKRVVSLVETLPPADLPRDFSSLIMQRIENPHVAPVQRTLMTQPVTEAGTAVVSAHREEAASAGIKITTTQTVEQKVAALQVQRTQQTQKQHSQSELLRRLTAGGVLSSVLAYFLSTAWGRQMLNVNMTTAGTWLGQVADVLRGVPVLTWMVGLIFSALAQLNTMLGQTYHVMGTAAAVGLALDAAVCIAAYSFLTARRREAQMHF